MNEKLIEIEKQMNRAEEQAQEEITEIKRKINEAQESKERLADEYLQAKENFDVEAYTKASEEMRSATDVTELYNSKIKHLEETAVITKEEYETYKQAIIKELEAEDKQAREKVNKLLEEAELLRDELNMNLVKGNSLLRRLQRTLYKEPKVIEKQTDGGRTIKTASLDDKYQSKVNAIHTLNKMLQAK